MFWKAIKTSPIKFRITETSLELTANIKGYNIPVGTIGVDKSSFSEVSRKKLLSQLNHSISDPLISVWAPIASGMVSIYLFVSFGALSGSISAIAVAILSVALWLWETKRRTITLSYILDDEAINVYGKLLSALNCLLECRTIWAIEHSHDILDTHESKLNAGASQIISKFTVKIGQGYPPWIKSNIEVPAIIIKRLSIYFMPDGIYIYKNRCVDFIRYENVTIRYSTTQFIDETPSSDAKIVDYTWKYPNRSGGPDRRFKDNYEIPVCLFGELFIEMEGKYYLHLMTSRHDAVSKFHSKFESVKRKL